MPPITCHILDTTRGKPASDVIVAIYKIGEVPNSSNSELIIQESSDPFGLARTNQDGRITDWNFHPSKDLTNLGIDSKLQKWNELKSGIYKIRFQTRDYFKRLSEINDDSNSGRTFFPFVEIIFTVDNPPDNHYHIPLLLSNHSYTTYRGS
ncbi:hypothetical protein WICMUC_005519 [Wickerhamomyces mucosus]|uniref:5-hydroxyisourate hydrolase n=1 Tax=Wickerhamomyces mucosus TaxID=1378264 RepID=A0A9P8P8D2_9ASCO|nr:hypothetical protein WICMUC_005519 [Wickerhamomyces mucosus]